MEESPKRLEYKSAIYFGIGTVLGMIIGCSLLPSGSETEPEENIRPAIPPVYIYNVPYYMRAKDYRAHAKDTAECAFETHFRRSTLKVEI